MKPSTENCATCPVRPAQLERLGVDAKGFDSVIALAGNPNTGKSTVFNALTGLRQHTGNWPGKTIARAEGAYSYGDRRYKIVDLPGTYSLLSASPDEEVTRDFLLFGKPDVTVIVTDASALERNLNLVLQVMEITPRCVLALNLMDEARARGLAVDARGLARDLGIPVVPMAARNGEGMENLLKVIGETATREPSATHPMTSARLGDVEPALDDLTRAVITHLPGVANPRWIALRLLGGDARITIAVASGELTQKTATPPGDGENDISSPDPALTEALLAHAARLRWDLPPDFHDRMTEAIYAESSRLCERNVSRSGANTRAAWESKLDQILTSRHWGLLAMALVFAGISQQPARGQGPTRAPSLSGQSRIPELAHRHSGRRHVSDQRLGGQCDAAAHGDLFPAFHLARGFGISAARRFQPRPLLSALRRPWQAGTHHGHGIRMQCRRRGRRPRDRLAARTPDRHHHQ